MGLGELLNRAHVNINVTTTNEAGQVLGADVYTVTDGLIPSWAAQPYRGAMNLPGAWRAAIIAADLLGSLPWEAYDPGPQGVPVLADVQPAVLTQPAPPDAGVTTVSSFMLDYIWHGNAIALKGPLTPDGDVSVLAPVPINNVAIGRSNGRDLDGFRRGEVAYRIGNGVYHADQIWHLKGPCEPGALRGLGALEVHLSGAIRTGLELQRQAGQLDIAGIPTGTLKVDAPDLTSDEAAVIRANWLAAQRQRTVAILNDVTDFTPLAWNPTESQLLEARRFSLHETALIVGVPLYFLGVPAGSETYSNVEQEGIVLTRYHVNGGIRRMEAAFTGCMRPGRKVLADISDALRADTLTRYQAWQVGTSSGFLTANEVRMREGLPPIAGGDALTPPPTAAPQTATRPDTGPTEIGEGEKQQGRSADDGDGWVDDLGPAEFAAVLDVWLAEEVRARGGGDANGSNLKAYWTTGPGRARWTTWTQLYQHLTKYLSPDRAKRTASQWFHDAKGYWPGDSRNRSAVDQHESEHERGRHSFNPDQPRDPDGKWGDGGATGGGTNMFGMPVGPGGRRRRPDPGDSPLAANTGGAPAPAAATSGPLYGSGLPGDTNPVTAPDEDDGESSITERPGDVTSDVDKNGRRIEIGRNGAGGVRIPEIPKYDGYGGGDGTGLKRYKLNTDKYCPECGGKAQDPQYPDPKYSAADFAIDGAPLWFPSERGDDVPEKDDSPYHDPTDPEYVED